MSVYEIYYKGGAKYMRPVRTREEYLQLRNLAVQVDRVKEVRKGNTDMKNRLLQFNYSCIPGEDGRLRGCKQMSNSFGMDIDHVTPEDMQPLAEKILQMKDSLGLLMLERSARAEGYHLVMKRDCSKTQEENLKATAEKLGVEYDAGAKDITRVFFATTADKDDLIYLDDEIFKQSPTKPPLEGRMLNTHEASGTASPDIKNFSPSGVSVPRETFLPPENGRTEEGEKTIEEPKGVRRPLIGRGLQEEVPQSDKGGLAEGASLKAFDMCVHEAGLSPDKMDIWGEHNWHTNLMAVLSVGLPKLMSREQLMAVVREKVPNYSQTEDCKKLIDYFFDNYSADKGFMSTTLREINAKAQESACVSDEDNADDEEEDEKALEALSQGWNPPELPKKLPRLMNLLVSNYDPRFREMLILASLPVLSAHASHFRARYLNGSLIGPQQYVAVIGASGQGKGNATQLYKEMIENTLQDHDDREWEKVAENAELRDKLQNAKERPPKYHPQLRLFETTSKTSILELQTNLGRNGMLLGQFSEVDGLSGSTRSGWSDISVLLRKGWDMDLHRQFYMSDSTCNTCATMSISLLMAGTVNAMLQRMFSDANCEGGFMQRCIPVLLPKTKRTFRPPRINYLSDDEKQERDALLIELYQKDLALGDDVQILDTPLMNRTIGRWFDELEERYNDGQLTEAEADLSHRCGEFMLRAAIPLIALYGSETKEIIDLCRWVGDYALYAQNFIFGHRVQENIASANEMLSQHLDARKTIEPLLSQMPEIFTIQQLKEQRVKIGQSPEVRMLLSRYCKKGKLIKVGRGVFRKCNM